MFVKYFCSLLCFVYKKRKRKIRKNHYFYYTQKAQKMTVTKVQVLSQVPNRGNAIQKDVHKLVPTVTRRCLFGVPDKEELQAVWNKNSERESHRMLTKYGFDVKLEKFVGGNFTSSPSHHSIDKKTNMRGQKPECNTKTIKEQQYRNYKSQARQTHLTGIDITKH